MSILIASLLLFSTATSCRVGDAGGDHHVAVNANVSEYSFESQPDPQQAAGGDNTLDAVRRLDQGGGAGGGALPQMSSAEHLRRGGIYLSNRAFEDARRHWRTLIERYPNDAGVSAAMFWTGRSYFQERKYQEALDVFRRLAERDTQTKEGRDGYYYVAPTLLRLGRQLEAAARYREYVERFPQGERINDAHLNVIDSLREGGNYEEAFKWVAITRERFVGTPTATNALFAKLRLEVAMERDGEAFATADELLRGGLAARGVSTSVNEVTYLRAFCLERSGRTAEAVKAYQSIPDTASSYYGNLATERLIAFDAASEPTAKVAGQRRRAKAAGEIKTLAAQYPAPHRELLLRYARARQIDPRLLLSVMKQESSFNTRAKSPAAARGLMQLTYDTALKYAERAGLQNLREDDLYRPEVSIRLACEYFAELFGMFPNLPEAAAASYNGGEDNVERWVKRADETDRGVIAAEVGFSETKDYVFKVMANYRVYSQLYTADLRAKSATETPAPSSPSTVRARRVN